MSVTGLPGQGPVRVGIPIADLCGGIFAAYGVTVALLEREQSGKGQWLHTSLLEAMLYMMDFKQRAGRWTTKSRASRNSIRPAFRPAFSKRVTGTSTLRCSAARFGALCGSLDSPEWISDERSKTKSARSVNRDWLNAEIEQRLQQHSSDYWIEKLNAAGVACGRINNVKQAFEEPQVQHLQMLKKVTSNRLGEQVLMGQPITLTRTPSTIARATPDAASTRKKYFSRSATPAKISRA